MQDVPPVHPKSRNPAGRPRDAKKREAVLAAARALIVEQGYAAATIKAIADRSGVSRPMIYQRWGDRVTLLEEALYREHSTTPDTGSLEGDIAELIGELVADVIRPEMRRGLTAHVAEVLETRGRGGRFWEASLVRWAAPFEAAAQRGEITASAAATRARLALYTALGSLMFMSKDPTYADDELQRAVMELLRVGLLRTDAGELG